MTFTQKETRALAALAEAVVPASAEYGLPGADDPAILEAILHDAERHRGRIKAALAALDELAGGSFADSSPTRRVEIAEAFRAVHPADAELIANLTVQGYYRDDRVMASLGLEPRPPHPKGYAVEPGDWSLLDPVRGRTPLYRKPG